MTRFTNFTRREFLLSGAALAALPRISPARSSARAFIFREAAAETGLDFHHFSGAAGDHLMPEILGSGVALLDYDNDGDLDVYLLQATELQPGKPPLRRPPPGWRPGNRLFRNMLSETGRLRFEDVTDRAGVGSIGYGMGVAAGDYDNDGYTDLYVTNFGHNILYHNNGDGTFADVTQQAGVDDPRWSTSAAWVDYDGDGLLDLFVCNYVDFTVAGNKRCFAPAGQPDYCSPLDYKPVPSRLFRNLGNGRFEDVSESSGIASSYGPALGVICADFNGDGLVDIYVADDADANRLWLNQGNGHFKEGALEAGLAYSADGAAKAGMGLDSADIDNDGHLEIIVTNLTGEGATLFRSADVLGGLANPAMLATKAGQEAGATSGLSGGRGEYDDVTAQYGLQQATFGYTGYGVGFFDYDNDGCLDLFVANGAMTIPQSGPPAPLDPYAQRNQLFHNAARSHAFREVTGRAGPALRLVEVNRGAAFGDVDNDGRVDIVVTTKDGPARLLLNQADPRGRWLLVKLEAAKGNRTAMGAEVGVFRRGMPALWRRAHSDGSMLSASDIRVHFGLGDVREIDSIVVRWPSGVREKWTSVQSNQILTLHQGTGRPA